ncbi:MAG TPA: hypothetical protein VMK12_01960 [Anaeromyxobacteraceae bacterium]|nr:hypothetical protein [Anaeromyxobacteraceae bacterium]
MRRFWASLVAGLSAGVFGISGIGSVAAAGTATHKIVIDGAVSCSYHPLSGVWISSSGGGSGFAHWDFGSSGKYDGDFSLTIATTLPTNLSLHIGCGTGATKNSWWSDNYTPVKSVSTSVVLEATCNEGNAAKAPAAGVRCSFGPTRSEQAAINWATPYVNKPSSTSYNGLCLTFVNKAYAGANVVLQNFIVPQMNNSTYPQGIWRRFKQLQKYVFGGPGIPPQPVTAQSGIYGGPETVPPPGALVFFNQKASYNGHPQSSGYYSHIELTSNKMSSSKPVLISSGDYLTTKVHYETWAQATSSGTYDAYVGWWLPA